MRKRNPRSGMDVTPLVDVLLILVVILLIVMPLYAKRLPVDIPVTSLSGAPTQRQAVQLTISKTGELGLSGAVVSKQDLLAAISTSSSIEISADKAVSYGFLSEVIDSLQSKHPENISLITR